MPSNLAKNKLFINILTQWINQHKSTTDACLKMFLMINNKFCFKFYIYIISINYELTVILMNFPYRKIFFLTLKRFTDHKIKKFYLCYVYILL